jgi:iron complex outermembrane receptor protein
VYGQLGYRVSEAVKVHGSLRYTDEDKSYRDGFATLNVTPGVPFDFVLPCCQSQDYQLDENWSGDAGVDWTPTENAMLYAKITRGFKSGGFFGGFALSEPETFPYVEETVWAYEIGAKTEWLDSTLRLNGAVFYYDYSDVQGFTQVAGEVNGEPLILTKLDNIGDAEHVGAEADLLWLPAAVEGLSLAAGVAWLDAELDSDQTFLSQEGVATSYDGLDRAYAPEWSYFAQGRYERALGASLLGVVQVSYSWRDDLVTEDSAGALVDAALFRVDGYGLWNARVQVGALDDRWNVAFVGKNLADEEYLASTTADNLGSYTRTPGLPYNWAIELNIRWQ